MSNFLIYFIFFMMFGDSHCLLHVIFNKIPKFILGCKVTPMHARVCVCERETSENRPIVVSC